jgi:hypothetical protein
MIDAMCLAVTILVGLSQLFTVVTIRKAAISILKTSCMMLCIYAGSTSHGGEDDNG